MAWECHISLRLVMMRRPRSPEFPFVSSMASNLSITCSPDLIFICLNIENMKCTIYATKSKVSNVKSIKTNTVNRSHKVKVNKYYHETLSMNIYAMINKEYTGWHTYWGVISKRTSRSSQSMSAMILLCCVQVAMVTRCHSLLPLVVIEILPLNGIFSVSVYRYIGNFASVFFSWYFCFFIRILGHKNWGDYKRPVDDLHKAVPCPPPLE